MRMTQDLFEARSRLVLALQQCLQLEDVVKQFSKSAERADHEAASCRGLYGCWNRTEA